MKIALDRLAEMRHNVGMKTLIRNTEQALDMRHPIKVKVYPGDGVSKEWAAYHTFKRGKHRVHIGAEPARGFHTILAHEIAHALCDEVHPGADFHGIEFAVAALVVSDLWKGWGIELGAVYDPEIDL